VVIDDYGIKLEKKRKILGESGQKDGGVEIQARF
jgi:hypothetical protein